jgi:IS5 family transposase
MIVFVDSDQPSFTDVEYGNRRRTSRREQFLETMDATIPWARWVKVIEPYYYRDAKGKRGRKAKPVETMLPSRYEAQDVSVAGVVLALGRGG